MTHLVFFLEERSAEEMLKGILPKFLPQTVSTQFVVFEGKQDLEKRLPIQLRAWLEPNVQFVVMLDQDHGDCVTIKNSLTQKCANAGKSDVLVRIACRELESFYLGDLAAVAKSIGPANLSQRQNKANYRNPDRQRNPSKKLKNIAPNYQKVSGSRLIAPEMNNNNNCSQSFRALIDGVKRVLGVDQ